MADVLDELEKKHAQKTGVDTVLSDLEAQQAEREKNVHDPNAYKGEGGYKELARATGEGLFSLPDLVPALSAGIVNLPRRLNNTADAAAAPYLPGGEADIVKPQPKRELETAPQLFKEAYRSVLPADPRYPGTTKFGNILGGALPAIVAPPLLAQEWAALPAATVDALATSTGAYAGSAGGRAVGQAVGGNTGGDYGDLFGSLAGSLVTPGSVATVTRGLRPILTDAGTAGRIRAFDAAGIPVTAGGVGSKQAGFIEDSIAGVPIAGGPVFKARRAQREAMDKAAIDTATEIRGQPYQGQGISEASIGGDVRNAAENAIEITKLKGDAVINPVFDPIRDLPVNQTPELQRLEQIRLGEQVLYGRPIVQREIDRTNASRLDPENPPKIVDVNREAFLQSQLQQNQSALARAQTMLRSRPGDNWATTVAQKAQDAIDDLNKQIDANRGSLGQEVIEQRSNVANRLPDGEFSLPDRPMLDIKQAKTDTLREAAIREGVSPEAFDTANTQWGQLKVQRDQLKPLAEGNQGSAYTGLFGGSGERNLDLQRALDENTSPSELGKIFADNLELKLRGQQSAGSAVPNPETVDPARALKEWTSLDPETKALYAPPGSTARAKLDALEEVYRAELRRPTRSIPGKGGNTMGGPLALLTTAGGVVGGVPGAAAGGLMTVGSLWALAKAMTNPRFIRSVANPPPFASAEDLPRLLSGAVASQPTEPPRRRP
jgi:hypothetical protein